VTGVPPVIVLSYQHAGTAWLQQLLATDPSLACTAGTGLLPACDQAATAWRQADGRHDGPLSGLGATSVRAMALGLITSMLAKGGQRRWCEAAAVGPGAGTFLALFPATRFVCLHRSCPDVIRATLAASPWGLAGPQYVRYTLAHPASTLTALAAYWADQTEQLLAFERDHRDACVRIRYEDLLADAAARRELGTFLELDLSTSPGDGLPAAPQQQPGSGEQFPASRLPAGSLSRLNELHAALGYPPINDS
jgi:Sulfotransferase family